ncbi:hypothetical protein BO71DRAFT_478958 [Aspergillus ellipticus CBS 707.79]|uniref:Uncharacterized protein n=1 Tax=Aspergillus ellipticus CBS 707.79 TaxID=1448320 RepID=A0A319E0Z3_9EURO|nr:hypothetical protein BO71DRAFT_478958 [Aspergillus ellipticus CBS 707.79]
MALDLLGISREGFGDVAPTLKFRVGHGIIGPSPSELPRTTTVHCWALLGSTGLYWALLGSTGLCWALLGSAGLPAIAALWDDIWPFFRATSLFAPSPLNRSPRLWYSSVAEAR